ncbi:MAG TPA: ACT domain-containing protein [Oceanithermus profundus]|uniref:ACT domain-containing protein n=1 Tax=Oceanithermus profundus TaxID=187137 RepID=A0A7C4V5I9_9DEIN|nr:ACT domain-containing protein [Oceanithermus profundus]
MKLWLLPGRYAVCRTPAPPALTGTELEAVLSDKGGWTWVGPQANAPATGECWPDWRALMVEGPLPFELTGVLARLSTPLAAAGVPVFALSTWSTDVLLVPAERLQDARAALHAAGHELADAP